MCQLNIYICFGCWIYSANNCGIYDSWRMSVRPSGQIVRFYTFYTKYQIVLVKNCPQTWAVSNCPQCQIVLGPLEAQPKWCVFESHRTKCNFWKWTRSPEGRSSGDENKSHLSKQVCWSIEQKHKDKKFTFYFRYFVKMLSIFYPYWHLYSEQDPRSRLGKIDLSL